MTAPNPAPSEAYLRQKLVGAGDTVEVQSGAVEAVLAELDRQRGETGPAPDRAAAELAEAEWNCRHAIEHEQVPSLDWSLPIVLAELDRQRVIVRAAEALVECDAAKPGLGQSISVWRRQRRELLDALAAAVRALLGEEGR